MFRVITGREMGKVLFCHKKKFRKKKIEPIKNREGWVKPKGGLWTSPFNKEEGSEWIYWCNVESFATYKRGYLLKPKKDSKFAVIDSLEDLLSMLETYKQPLTEWQKKREFNDFLDFEKLMRHGYDGIYLTSGGQSATRKTQPNLYGWDCETVFWFKPKFRKIRKIRVKKWSWMREYEWSWMREYEWSWMREYEY